MGLCTTKSLLVPPQTKNFPFPPSKDCASKNITCSVPLECSSWPETHKKLVINPVFVGKNRFFADFAKIFCFLVFTPQFVEFRAYYAMKTFFYGLHSRIRGKKFLCSPKIVYAPPVTLPWRQARLYCTAILICNNIFRGVIFCSDDR